MSDITKSNTGVYVHPGTFKDEHTFLDPKGVPYKLIQSKFPKKKRKKIRVDITKRQVQRDIPGFGWRNI